MNFLSSFMRAMSKSWLSTFLALPLLQLFSTSIACDLLESRRHCFIYLFESWILLFYWFSQVRALLTLYSKEQYVLFVNKQEPRELQFSVTFKVVHWWLDIIIYIIQKCDNLSDLLWYRLAPRVCQCWEVYGRCIGSTSIGKDGWITWMTSSPG